MQNSGNEAKKYLKTKDITFLNAADSARFARKLTPIGPHRSKNRLILQKRTEACGSQGEPRKGTKCRLHENAVAPTKAGAQEWAPWGGASLTVGKTLKSVFYYPITARIQTS